MIAPVWIVGFSGHPEFANSVAISITCIQALQKLKQKAEEKQGHLELYGSAASPRIIEQLQLIREGFLTHQTQAALRRTVVMTKEILLDELIEWHLVEQHNGRH